MTDPVSRGDVRSEAGGLPRERAAALLADARRRYVLAYLREAHGPVALADLARRIADREADAADGNGQGEYETVYHSLYHCHVPKLAEADVVAFDRDRNAVERGADFDALWDVLAAAEAVQADE